MPGPFRPSAYPDWATGPSAAIIAPPSPEVAKGWIEGEAPAAEWMNYLQNLYGEWVRWFDNEINFVQSDANVCSSMRLINGGWWGFVQGSQQLSWSAAFNIRIPSIPDAYNQVAAGNVVIPDGSSMYVRANIPLNTTANTQNGSNILQNVQAEEGIVVGQTISGVGIPGSTTVVDFDENTQTVTMSNPATADGANVGITFSGTGALTAQVAPSASITPSPNLVILATRVGNFCYVGANGIQMFLKDNDRLNFNTRLGGYDAVTGTGSTASDTSIANALARLAIIGGSGKILVGQTENIASPIDISFPDVTIEFAPGVSLIAASASVGFRIASTGVKVKSGRFQDFMTAAIQYLIGANYGSVFDTRFKNCTDEVDDATATSNIQVVGTTTEA